MPPSTTRPGSRAARGALTCLGLLAALALPAACTEPPPGDDDDQPPPPDPPSTPLRRLNRVELVNTLGDLLGPAYTGDLTELPGRIPADPVVGGLDTIAASLGTSATYVEQMGGLMEYVAAHVDLAQLAPGAADATAVPVLLDGFGRKALRRPLTADERTSHAALYARLATAQGHEVALRAVVQRLLSSPDFLYHVALGDPATGLLTDHELAARLSYLLWETMPDAALATAADAGELHTPAQVEAAIARMAADARTGRALLRFTRAWMQVEGLDTIAKDPRLYPEFPALRASMRESFDRFLVDTVATGDVDTLLTSNEAYVDDALAGLYGVASPGPMTRVPLQPGQRAGVLTQAAFLTVLGKANRSSPILRGVFVLDRLLCTPPDPPPPGGGVIPPDLPQPTTTRAFFTDLTAAPGCNECHQVINPIGFGFGHYDAIGRWRIEEQGYPIDATGHLVVDGQDASFDGALQLTRRLSTSTQVRRCLVQRWFRSRFGRAETAADDPIVDALDGAFAAEGSKLAALARILARTDAFYRPHFQLPRAP